jgi:ribonucleoside-diphosphate reductase alpha chain
LIIDNIVVVDRLNNMCPPEIEALTRMVSTALRHGADINFVVHQLEKTGGSMENISKKLAVKLKTYIKDGTTVFGEDCPGCGSTNIIRQEGCFTCKSCGYAKC